MSRARSHQVRRRFRRAAVQAVRRSRLLPSTVPDRLGDDDALAESSLSQTVMVYFADTRESLYQLRPWYEPLKALNKRHAVVVVCQDSRTASVIRAELGLPVITIARYGALDGLLGRSDLKLALYVNHTPQNFSGLRFTSLAHVYLTHGDSDKGVTVSHQNKAYDFCFVAGQAAIDRFAAALMFTEPAQWCRTIGRPQLDAHPVASTGSGDPGHPTVLYAPTWEGAQPSVAYGSIASMGLSLVTRLIESGSCTVVYRPHPLSGVTDATYGAADARIRSFIEAATARDPAAGHRVAVGGTLEEAFGGADLLVCDVSAAVMDWLPSGKPLVVTEPQAEEVVTAGTALLDVVPRLAPDGVADVVGLIRDQVTADPTKAERLSLVEYYLGDITPGAATQRFVDACSRVIAERDAAWQVITARGRAGR